MRGGKKTTTFFLSFVQHVHISVKERSILDDWSVMFWKCLQNVSKNTFSASEHFCPLSLFFSPSLFFLTVWGWMRTIHQIHHNFTAVFSPTWKPFFQQNYHFFKILDQPLKKKREPLNHLKSLWDWHVKIILWQLRINVIIVLYHHGQSVMQTSIS